MIACSHDIIKLLCSSSCGWHGRRACCAGAAEPADGVQPGSHSSQRGCRAGRDEAPGAQLCRGGRAPPQGDSQCSITVPRQPADLLVEADTKVGEMHATGHYSRCRSGKITVSRYSGSCVCSETWHGSMTCHTACHQSLWVTEDCIWVMPQGLVGGVQRQGGQAQSQRRCWHWSVIGRCLWAPWKAWQSIHQSSELSLGCCR